MGIEIKWHKSIDGFVNSHCGQFNIQPLYWGSVAPQSYALYYKNEKIVERNTQSELKDIANDCIK